MLIWDMDGTLRLLSLTGLIKSYREIIKYAGKNPNDFFNDTASFLKWFSHYWWDNMISIGRTDDKFIKKTTELFHEIYDPHIYLFPWVINTISQLSPKYRQAIFTSSRGSKVTAFLRKSDSNLLCYFHPIIGSEHVKNIKPNPEGIEKIIKYLQILPSDCVIIGDTRHDFYAGKSAGIKTGLVKWGAVATGMEQWENLLKLTPDYIFENPEDLLTLL